MTRDGSYQRDLTPRATAEHGPRNSRVNPMLQPAGNDMPAAARNIGVAWTTPSAQQTTEGAKR